MEVNATRTADRGGSNKRYIDLRYDIGFKIVLADPDRPEYMLELLRALIPERRIASISFMNSEIIPEEVTDKRNVYDIRCIEEDGDSFVVEMQKNSYSYIYDRLVMYSGDPLKRMLKAGQDYSKIHPVYIICIADFFMGLSMDTEKERRSLVRRARLVMNDTHEVLSDKLNFVFLQLPVVEELMKGQSFLEKFAFVIRNIGKMQEEPEELKGNEYFDSLFKMAERTSLNQEKLKIYDNMIRDEIQIKAEKDFAVKEAAQIAFAAGQTAGREEGREEGLAKGLAKGREEGREEGRTEEKYGIAKKLKDSGIPLEVISQSTGLTLEEVKKI